MSTEVVVQKVQLPAHLAAFAALSSAKDLTSNVGVSYPVLSLKGKVWAVSRSGERQIVMNEENEPRASIEAILLRANPALSKVYYPDGYEEGSTEKPACYSNDGIRPGSDAQTPQSATCQGCPHNAWGSKISDTGAKLKACTDSRRMAVAAPTTINDPMLLRIPAASLKGLAEYGEAFDKKGIPYQAAVTKLSFDPEASSPKVLFKFVRFITAEEAKQVLEVAESSVIKQITGLDQPSVPVTADVNRETKPAALAPSPASQSASGTDDTAKKAAEAKAKKDAENKAKAKAEAEARAKAEAKARAEADAAAKAAAPAAAPKVETAGDLEAALTAALAIGG